MALECGTIIFTPEDGTMVITNLSMSQWIEWYNGLQDNAMNYGSRAWHWHLLKLAWIIEEWEI